MYGDSKEAISNWCLRYAAERKIFTGGVLEWDLKNFSSCRSFLQRIKSDLIRSDDSFRELLQEYGDLDTYVSFI